MYVYPNGTQPLIAFASQTLNEHEKRYGQIDKEVLAIMFGLKRFHLYLYGRHFTILMDHKPLEQIFGLKMAIPSMAAMRLQCWAIILSAFDYSIRFVPSKQNVVVDALSITLTITISDENAVFKVEEHLLDSLPITHKKSSHATRVDPVLSKVLEFVRHVGHNMLKICAYSPFSIVDLSCLSNKIACYGDYESLFLPAISKICWRNYTQGTQALSGSKS